MGKKTTKRKTRWRTLSIGEVPSDTEEETHENHTTPNYYKNVKLRSFKTPTPTSDNNSTRSTFNNYSYRRNSGGSNNSSSYYYNHSTTHNGTSTPSNTTNHHHYQREPSSYGAGAHYQRTSSDYTSSFHHNLRNGGSGSSTSTGGGGVAASTSQSSHSTPIRSRYHRNHGYNGTGDKYKSSRSNSTASEPKITFNEDEYTRITTPRQDVLFKKGYLSKKKPLTVVSGDTAQNHHDSNGLMANGGTGQHHMNGHSGGIINNGGGGSCGESNPSTGYNSTTGGGTPEHHSLDGGDYYDTDIDQHQPPFIIHNGFVDHNGVFYVNGYDPFSMMLIGPPPPPPPGQFIHPVDFYPPPPPSVSGVPCFPQITPSTSINNQNDSTTSNSSKRCSTDSQADESNSPHNENESSGETNNFASSEQSQSSSLDNNLDQQSSDNQTNNLTPTNTDSGVQIIDDNNTTDDCAKSNPDDGSSDSVEPITNSSSTQSQTTTISSTSVPIVEEDVIVPTNDGLIETPPAPILPMQQSNSFVAPRIYPIPATPTHFFLTAGPPPTGFIPFPPPTAVPGQPIYINDINIQPSSALNPGIVDPSKQRYIQKRRRRKLSKSQNDIEKKYSDNSGSSTSDEFEPEELSLEKHSASLDDTANDKTPTIEMYSVIDDISNETKDKQLPSPRCTPPPLVNGDSVITNDSKETQKSLSTVYKLDAEEFVPRSMRLQQTASTSIDEKSINPELRAKFENYLNRQSTNISDEQNGYMVGEFIPSDFIFHHPGEIHHHYQLEQQLIGTSYPSSQAPPQASKHFIHHNQFLPPRRQFVNGYNKKRQKYIKPNHYYKSNYKNYSHDQQQQSTSTKVEHDDDNKADDCKPQSMTETHVNTETNESASLPIEKTITDNDENVTKDLVLSKVDSKENVEPKLEVTASNDETNKSLEVVVVTPSENKSINEIQKKNESPPSITCANQDEKITKTETFDKSVMTVIDNKPNVTSTDVKEQQITPSSPIRIHKPLQKIENNSPTVLKVSSKNYAQILRKDDKMTTSIQQSKTIRKDNLTATKTSPVSSKIQNKTKTVQQPIRQLLKSSSQNVQKSTTNKIQIEPVHRPKVPLVNSLPEDNEWISVPSRKKGKVKSYQQIPLSMSLHENYLTPELIDKVEKVSEPKVEKTEPIVNTTEETVKTEEILDSSASTETVVASNKSVSPAVQIKNTKKPVVNKLSHTPKNSVKKTKIIDSVIKSDKQIEKIKTPIENVISKQETVMPQQSTTPPDVSKKQKGKSLKKQVIKENNPSTNQNTAIGESIDNLRKMSTEHSKTNIEISKEMDRLIQQGLYKNLGNTIKSLGHDKEFLSIIDPNINILPKMMFDPQLKMKGQNENLLELNIMETLNECQRYFANKNIKDVMFDSSSSTKDVKNQTVQDEETNSNIASVVGSSVTSDDGNVQICDSVETNNKASQISNISASIPSTSRVDETRDEQVEKLSTTPNGVLITATSSSSDKNIDEKTGKNVPIIIENNTNEADLSDNDDTLLSFKFDSNENISVITEEPHASVNNEDIEELELDENTSIKHSPDPDSWSSHTNLTTTSTEFTSNKLSTMSQQHKSLTEVVKEWLTEAQEKSPNVFKSPEKIYREKSAPPKLYHQYNNDSDSYDSEPEVGKSNEQEQETSKNVKGNPLFVASANTNQKSSLHHSFLSLIEPLITSNGYSVSASVSGAAIGEDALLANRRVAIDTNKTDFKTIAKRRIKENVAVFARELVNTVNPVVDGMNIETEDDEDKLKSNTNYCCEVNEHTDLNNEQGEIKNKLTTAGMQFTIKGAFVRDVGIIKRTVSENGAIFNNPTTSIVNNTFNSDVNSYVNKSKSKSCIDMKLLFVENEKQINNHSSLPSTREGSQEQQQYWEEDPSCWIHDDEDIGIESITLLNNEKPLIKNGGTKICIKNNLTNCDEQNIYNKKELNNKKKDNKIENEDDDIIETYESMYGKNLDYLEIRQKVLNECEQKSSTSSSQPQPRVLNADPPCVLGQRGAVCCSIQ